MEQQDNYFSPKSFLKNRRSEKFSDSIEIEHGQLDRVQLEYYLSTLNTRSQELVFEDFAKALCEKVICPNLLKQTGPVAGGDGKTDTQTFPVSEQNQLLWYEGINDSSHKERWAFGVSVRKDWKVKCKEDVEKIVMTNRGYKKAFCVTNQSIKSNQRSDTEDLLGKQFSIEVTILDLSWILDQVYKHKLIELAIETLTIPTNYKREIKTGENDYKKQLELERLNSILCNVNPQNITKNQVDYFLEIAILSKELERPIIETQGLFGRAIKISKKFGSNQQQIDAYYEYARAAYWWLEDFQLFEENLENVFNCLSENSSASKWEDLVTLLISHIGDLKKTKRQPSIDIDSIVYTTKNNLLIMSEDESRPSNALRSKISLCMLRLVYSFGTDNNIDDVFKELLSIFRKGEGLVGFPFLSTYNFLLELDSIFLDNEEYEKLLDYLVQQENIRHGETSSALLMLKRGIKRLQSNKPYQAIKLIGKSQYPLYKDESASNFVIACSALSVAYSEVGLQWAARASQLQASSLLTDRYWKNDEILPMAVKSYWKLAYLELALGRIAHSLIWYDLARHAENMLEESCLSGHDIVNYDGCLGHLIANCTLNDLKELEYLPDYLKTLELNCSYGVLLYSLGYPDKFASEFGFEVDEEQLKFLVQVRDIDIGHPTSKYTTVLGRNNLIKTIVLGCSTEISFPNRSPLVEMAESILSSLESFFSTGVVDSLPIVIPCLQIDLIVDDNDEHLISHTFTKIAKGFHSEITCSNFSWEALGKEKISSIQNWFNEFILECLSRVCAIKDIDSILELLIKEDRALTRSGLFSACFGAVYNIIGDNAHKDTLDILNVSEERERYQLMRSKNWDFDVPKNLGNKNRKAEPGIGSIFDNGYNIEEVKHDQIKVSTIIKPNLWDSAGWKGIGFIHVPNEPPFLLLVFSQPQKGYEILSDLINEIGTNDIDDKLRISVIRGISKDNLSSYRIVIGENLYPNDKIKHFVDVSRINTMAPSNDINWNDFYELVQKERGFKLSFGVETNGQFSVFPNIEKFYIYKNKIIVKNAWEIQRNDPERVAIREDDDPVIPNNVIDAPVLTLLKKKK